MVDKLLSKTVDSSLLISRFQEFLEMDDVRYYVMSSVRENLAKVMDRSRGVGESSPFPHLSHPLQTSDPLLLCLFVGSSACVSEQRVHTHVQH